MLRNTNQLENHPTGATDGPVGHVKDIHFDDDAWLSRCVIVVAGSWLSSHEAVISPISVHHPHRHGQNAPSNITGPLRTAADCSAYREHHAPVVQGSTAPAPDRRAAPMPARPRPPWRQRLGRKKLAARVERGAQRPRYRPLA